MVRKTEVSKWAGVWRHMRGEHMSYIRAARRHECFFPEVEYNARLRHCLGPQPSVHKVSARAPAVAVIILCGGDMYACNMNGR